MNTTTTVNEFANKLTWTTNDIFDANFMFPVQTPCGVISSLDELLLIYKDDFYHTIEDMLTPCQPLSNEERVGLVSSVKSENRLRILYHTLQIIERTKDALNETQSITPIDMDDKASQDGRGITSHAINIDDTKESTYEQGNGLDEMDNQITSQEESNRNILSQQ